jgi:hypothetical protein
MFHSNTQISREGLAAGPDMTNRKPYRTKAQKRLARETATRREDGAYRSSAPVSYHQEKRQS